MQTKIRGAVSVQQDASKQLPAMSENRQPTAEVACYVCTKITKAETVQQAQRRNHKIVESKREVIVVSGRTGMS